MIIDRIYYAPYLPNRKNIESSTETESSSVSHNSSSNQHHYVRKKGKLPNNHVKIRINSISTSIDASTEDSLITTDDTDNLCLSHDIKSKKDKCGGNVYNHERNHNRYHGIVHQTNNTNNKKRRSSSSMEQSYVKLLCNCKLQIL